MSQLKNKNNLESKTAVITGGTRGIGKAISAELGIRGANLILNYLRNHKEAKKTQKELNENNINCSIYRCNIGDIESVDKFIDKIVTEHNKIDILINNAASGVMRKSTDLDVKHWDWTMDINARGTWYISKKLSNHMVNGGNIINISSPGSSMVLPDYFPIGVSKAALEAITRYLSIELAEKNISVNSVSAGYVLTDALNHFPDRDSVVQIAERATPAGRPISPQDIANVVAMLCSTDAEMIRGQNILVDGGSTINFNH
ncbi:MAG: enoyl-[acyl-carrier-protein] reductase FabL [Chloroflexi bacterium]|nr:enoyl-[acyl-carrier-protein] reductase FabL [Chloroflexota bacterium]MAR34687.1 enoyl-[acyl-carrier-protein] reductase FabL [Chloroflexota bacterium]|tara:strand:- start:10576 stop:11352 length:777 start_codon:yes stop_codon:yes gene_type:complete